MVCVNEGSRSFTCHPHVYPQVKWTIPVFTPQPQSITALCLVLISRPAEGRRLSSPGWLGEILRWFVRRRRSPIPVLTGPDVEQLRWYAQRRYCYATPSTSMLVETSTISTWQTFYSGLLSRQWHGKVKHSGSLAQHFVFSAVSSIFEYGNKPYISRFSVNFLLQFSVPD